MDTTAINTATARPVYDTRSMMREAHENTRQLVNHRSYRGKTYAEIFGGQLRNAWNRVKWAVEAALNAARLALVPLSQRIRSAIDCLESKDRWNSADYQTSRDLTAQYHAALAAELAA